MLVAALFCVGVSQVVSLLLKDYAAKTPTGTKGVHELYRIVYCYLFFQRGKISLMAVIALDKLHAY